jgi:hypothetical protein
MSKKRLVEYIKARRRGGFGWIPRYEKAVCPNRNRASLAGWYSGMLDELLRELPEREIDRICDRIIEREEAQG